MIWNLERWKLLSQDPQKLPLFSTPSLIALQLYLYNRNNFGMAGQIHICPQSHCQSAGIILAPGDWQAPHPPVKVPSTVLPKPYARCFLNAEHRAGKAVLCRDWLPNRVPHGGLCHTADLVALKTLPISWWVVTSTLLPAQICYVICHGKHEAQPLIVSQEKRDAIPGKMWKGFLLEGTVKHTDKTTHSISIWIKFA